MNREGFSFSSVRAGEGAFSQARNFGFLDYLRRASVRVMLTAR
jgi:hypothetical protein